MPVLLNRTKKGIQVEVQDRANHARFLPPAKRKVVISTIEELSGKRYITDGA
jgi:hypothetical protein